MTSAWSKSQVPTSAAAGDGFTPVRAREAAKAFKALPDHQGELDFGGYRVQAVWGPSGRYERGYFRHGWCKLYLEDPESGAVAGCQLDCARKPMGVALAQGVHGVIDQMPLYLRRANGPRIRRKSRFLRLSGGVELTVGYERGRSVVKRESDGTLLWYCPMRVGRGTGRLSPEATLCEVSVICAVVVVGLEYAGSWRGVLKNL